MEQFAIAAFRSRQAVFSFESALGQRGVRTKVISTPHQVALGCGLSLSFDLADLARVVAFYNANPVPNLVGFYKVHRAGGRTQVSPVNH